MRLAKEKSLNKKGLAQYLKIRFEGWGGELLVVEGLGDWRKILSTTSHYLRNPVPEPYGLGESPKPYGLPLEKFIGNKSMIIRDGNDNFHLLIQ